MNSFIHPGMLFGLLLAAVPIIIHLLNRRRYKTIRWAAQDFLKAAFKKNQKRLRIENLLLLIVRTLLIILLVLGLSRPFLRGQLASALAGSATHHKIILDNSYSMGLNEGLTTPFARGVREAQKIVSTMRPEDSVTLYLTNDNIVGARPGTPRAILRDSHDKEKVSSVLGRLSTNRASAGRSDLVDFLAQLADLLDPRQPGKRVHLITDLQRSSWESGVTGERVSADPAAGDQGLTGAQRTLRDLLTEIDRKGAQINVIDVGSGNPGNILIADLAPAEDRPLIERNFEVFVAKILNFGRSPREVDVVFRMDGEMKGTVRVPLPAARAIGAPGEALARFQLPRLQAGPHTFSAEMPIDALPIDDKRLFTTEVRERIRVLAVDGDPNADYGLSSETVYLKHAIAPIPDRIGVEEVDYLSFLTRELTDFDVLILANVERVREDKVREIEEFVRGGGALVYFLGNRVDPILLNRDFVKDGEGLFPGRILTPAVVLDRAESRIKVDLEGTSHPLLDRVIGPEADPEGFWSDPAPSVWGHYRLDIPDDRADIGVLLRLTDAERSPLLAEKRFGKGRVLLFATSADLDWNDFPDVGMMIPLLHEMVYYLTHRDASSTNLLPFAAYVRELHARVEAVTIHSPDGGRTTVTPIVQEGRRAHIEFRDTQQPGLYRTKLRIRGSGAIDAGTREDEDLFAVNVDTAEGDVRRISPGELIERYAGIDLGYAETFSDRVQAEERRPEGEIWRGLLFAVLALLFVEIFLARRFGDFGRRRSTKGDAA